MSLLVFRTKAENVGQESQYERGKWHIARFAIVSKQRPEGNGPSPILGEEQAYHKLCMVLA